MFLSENASHPSICSLPFFIIDDLEERRFFGNSWLEITLPTIFFPKSGFSFPIKLFSIYRFKFAFIFPLFFRVFFFANLLRRVLSSTCYGV